jgi:hypothetical protein
MKNNIFAISMLMLLLPAGLRAGADGPKPLSVPAPAGATPSDAAPSRDPWEPVPLGTVRVGGEIGRRIQVTVYGNLLLLDADKDFLPPFRKRTAKEGFIGLGNLVDAAVRFAVYTKDEKVLALKRHLVEETIRVQEPDGYLGMLAPAARISGMWDIHEMGCEIFGLTSDYVYFHDPRSLAAARKAADYIVAGWSRLPADWDRRTHVATHVSVTGLERALVRLQAVSGQRRYLDFCLQQRALPDWDLGIVIGRRDLIEGHVYAYMAHCLAQLDLYHRQPDERLLRQSQRAMDFLSAHDGMTITGGVGQREIWTGDQDGRGELAESCATAYQIRVYDSLLRLDGDSRYGDLMERTIYNSLFAAQSPDGRKIRYYTPFEGNRIYFPGDTYCCPCNFRRIIAELPEMIYYRRGNGLAVNLYAPSDAKIAVGPGRAINVRQTTDYPNSGRVVIHVDPTAADTFPVQLRIPRWCRQASVAVNGQAVPGPVRPGAFLTLNRRWQPGDEVRLEMAMPWRLVAGRQRQAGRVAVMRGPLVYCLNPAQNPGWATQDAADLNHIVLDPTTLEPPLANAAVRPDGTACRLKVRNPSMVVGQGGNLPMLLTEFPDPAGKCVYFTLADPRVAVADELLRP